jgi:two-component system chemotaxis response regulator CheY
VAERDGYQDCVRLSDTERAQLLRELAARSGGVAHSQRRDERHLFVGHNVHLDVFGEGGRVSRFLTYSRDLSNRGLSVIHGGFVYPGARCAVTLATLEGANETIEGRIARCSYVRGSLHELGIEFDRPVEPADFAPSAGEALSDETLTLMRDRSERLLFLDDSEAELRLFRHHLRETGFDVATARSSREACEQIRDAGVDLFVCDLDLGRGQRTGEEVIQLARGAGFSRPIMALTGQSEVARLQQAKRHGANAVLLKPYSPARLLTTVISLLDAA